MSENVKATQGGRNKVLDKEELEKLEKPLCHMRT